jgi:hypothetical protein
MNIASKGLGQKESWFVYSSSGSRMNLNEECLLQFLRNDLATGGADAEADTEAASLASDLRRVLRRNRFVSFPPAILVRRPNSEL